MRFIFKCVFPFLSVPAAMPHITFGVIIVPTLKPGLKRYLRALEMLIGKALLINGAHVAFLGARFLRSLHLKGAIWRGW